MTTATKCCIAFFAAGFLCRLFATPDDAAYDVLCAVWLYFLATFAVIGLAEMASEGAA